MNNKKNENSSDFIVKLVIFLGAIAAIFVAATLIYKKFNKHLNCLNEEETFNFDDDDFLDDCDFIEEEDADEPEEPKEKAEDAVENIEDVVEE